MTFVLGCLVVGLGIALAMQWRANVELEKRHRWLHGDYLATQKHADRLLSRCRELEAERNAISHRCVELEAKRDVF